MGSKGFCWIFRKETSQEGRLRLKEEGWDLRRQRIVVKYRGSLHCYLLPCIVLGPRSRLGKPERNNVRNLSGRDEV